MTLQLAAAPFPALVALEPFPAPASAIRRRVVGIDVWLEGRARPSIVDPAAVRAAVCTTPVRVHDVEVVGSDDVHEGIRCRMLVADGEHLTDEGVAEVLLAVAPVATWTVVRKLVEFDGVPAYTP